MNKHENKKCGKYYTHKFLSEALYFVDNNKNNYNSSVYLHSIITGKYHEKYNHR